MLASLRLKLITADLGYSLSFRDAVVALSAGQLAGSVFFQLAGQLIGRGMVLSRRGIPASAGLVISGYERFVALGVSLVLAAGGAIYLFGTLSFDLQAGGQSLIRLGLGLTFAIGAGALLAWGRKIAAFLRSLTPAMLMRLLRSIAISAAIQLTTLAAYVDSRAPTCAAYRLCLADRRVLHRDVRGEPAHISMGGWGLRELSAVVALQLIGLSSASALVVALMIGLMSLAVLAVIAIAFMIGDRQARGARDPDAGEAPGLRRRPRLAAAACRRDGRVFPDPCPDRGRQAQCQSRRPRRAGRRRLFVLRHGAARTWPRWRVPHMTAYAAAACAVIVFSALHGWIALGWSDWAMINKALGLLRCCFATR